MTILYNRLWVDLRLSIKRDQCLSKAHMVQPMLYFAVFLQSFTKHLRQDLVFMWGSALRERFTFCFSREF